MLPMIFSLPGRPLGRHPVGSFTKCFVKLLTGSRDAGLVVSQVI